MINMTKYLKNPKVLKLDDFSVFIFDTKPKRVEAKIEFDRNYLSQKLIFSLMEITHSFGVGCSPPVFSEEDDGVIHFYIGISIALKTSMKNQLKNLNSCLLKILDFAIELKSQLDFTNIDISMFDGFLLGDIEKLLAIKDQNYKGSWDYFYSDLLANGYTDSAELILKLKDFEEKNDKDLSLVGYKLSELLNSIESKDKTVFN